MSDRRPQQRTELTDQTFNSVKFINFPMYIDNETGEETYSLMQAVVADRYAEQFPETDRSAITVDFSKLDIERLLQEAKDDLGIKSPFETREEAEEAEQLLIQLLTDAGFFKDE